MFLRIRYVKHQARHPPKDDGPVEGRWYFRSRPK